jgi:hypothetical protein
MRIKKKKDLITQASSMDNFKPLDKSEKIISKTKERKLSEYFD